MEITIMAKYFCGLVVVFGLAVSVGTASAAPSNVVYIKKGTREETILATLKAAGLPTLQGKWHYIGPFDNADGLGFERVYPPEREIDLTKTYAGKGSVTAGWKEYPNFAVGKINDLRRFANNDHSIIYLYHQIDATEAVELPVSLGSDDSLAVWLN